MKVSRSPGLRIVHFHRNPSTLWNYRLDLEGVVPESLLIAHDAQRDIEELLDEVSATVGHAVEIEAIRDPQTFVDMPDHNDLPVEDITFITFDGCTAYQPCHKDIDLLNVFDPLRTIEGNPDPMFRAAREWSCIVQAREGLPKDVR
ncbi:gtpase-activator for ras gtpase [Fusarium heterosporum]|uniref:Gtpase-activator for ras gtpase n=1 Tax=Fusarium heterosporum TaxID=42747 RepID=A0A8H5U2W8_FUSHE|nr:gtpase-activator for ras gtpase [Fusarium heterosporum]